MNLKSLTESELEAYVEGLGQPAYRGRQLFQWIYEKGCLDFEEMTNLPKDFRQTLAENAYIGTLATDRVLRSEDGTIKGIFELRSGRKVESVLIPDIAADGKARRLTVCVSSQVGCAMGCAFCATGLMGFQQNLTAGEIYEQVHAMNELAATTYGKEVSNVVFMGMGEPLLNYDNVLKSIGFLTHEKGFGLSPRRITVSTVGLARRIKKLADDDRGVGLAVSLHAPTDEQRSAIMPVNRATSTDLTALREAITYFSRRTGQVITYEYCLFAGVNDADEDARALATIARWAPSKVNLMMYNPIEGLDFRRPTEKSVDRFAQRLVEEGVTVTVRRSRGKDIAAACGQLLVK